MFLKIILGNMFKVATSCTINNDSFVLKLVRGTIKSVTMLNGKCLTLLVCLYLHVINLG